MSSLLFFQDTHFFQRRRSEPTRGWWEISAGIMTLCYRARLERNGTHKAVPPHPQPVLRDGSHRCKTGCRAHTRDEPPDTKASAAWLYQTIPFRMTMRTNKCSQLSALSLGKMMWHTLGAWKPPAQAGPSSQPQGL